MQEHAIVIDPERMNLLGLMMQSLLRRKLASGSGKRLARWINGDVQLCVGEMRVTLRFSRDGVVITRDPPARPVVRVTGTMAALADAALGRNRIRSVVQGRLWVRGSPRAAACLLLLMRV